MMPWHDRQAQMSPLYHYMPKVEFTWLRVKLWIFWGSVVQMYLFIYCGMWKQTNKMVY